MDLIRSAVIGLALVTLAGALAGCGTTAAFYPHESRNNVYTGKGGSRFTVQGIDVWFNGDPPRKYAILGYIEDYSSVGVDELHRTIPPDVLKKAVEIGANGLIENAATTYGASSPSSSVLIHGGSGGMGLGLGFGYPISERVRVTYTAVKYLD